MAITNYSPESPYILDQAGNKVFKVDVVGNRKVSIRATYETEVAQGNIPGVEAIDKYGRVIVADIALDVPADIWELGGVYPGFPAEAETLEIVSDSLNDIAGGTGARTVTVSNLLDADKNKMPDVTVSLNGTTPVSIGAQTYSRASRVRVTTVGAGGVNEGVLTLRHTTTTANVFCSVSAGKNGTTQMTYTVPAGRTLYVPRGYVKMARANGSNGSANCRIKIRGDYTDAPFVHARDFDVTNSDGYKFENSGFFVFQEKTDIKVTVETISDASTIVMSEFVAFLVDN